MMRHDASHFLVLCSLSRCWSAQQRRAPSELSELAGLIHSDSTDALPDLSDRTKWRNFAVAAAIKFVHFSSEKIAYCSITSVRPWDIYDSLSFKLTLQNLEPFETKVPWRHLVLKLK